MAQTLRRHDSIAQQAVEAAVGVLFKTTGDGCCAVFSEPVSGVDAARALRRGLADEEWPEKSYYPHISAHIERPRILGIPGFGR